MKSIILAAGASTRLYSVTSSKPKCLLVVGDKTILDHQIDSLVKAGINEVVIVVGYKKEMIIEHLSNKNYPVKITYIHNDKYKTTGPIIGGLYPAKDHLNDTVIFSHCDVLFGHDAITHLIKTPHESAKLYKSGHWDEEAGKIIVDQSGRVIELGKHIDKKNATGEYLQIAKLSGNFCKRLVSIIDKRVGEERDGYTIDAFNDVVQDKSVTVMGIPFDGLVMEIDTPEDYEAAKKAWGNA